MKDKFINNQSNKNNLNNNENNDSDLLFLKNDSENKLENYENLSFNLNLDNYFQESTELESKLKLLKSESSHVFNLNNLRIHLNQNKESIIRNIKKKTSHKNINKIDDEFKLISIESKLKHNSLKTVSFMPLLSLDSTDEYENLSNQILYNKTEKNTKITFEVVN